MRTKRNTHFLTYKKKRPLSYVQKKTPIFLRTRGNAHFLAYKKNHQLSDFYCADRTTGEEGRVNAKWLGYRQRREGTCNIIYTVYIQLLTGL